uniref:VPS10 domain-containing protein n=1 Tax=Knipowitschia caucasica TaxID=637954 RepID=A0AAV2LL28_KNICA
MAGFDDAEEAVLLSPRGRKRKRKPEEHDRKLAKNARHSGGANAAVACVHNNVNVCQAAKLSPEDIDYMHHTLYTTTDKVKQDATLLSYMDVTAVKRRRSKIEDSAQQKSRDLTVKYSVLTRARDRIPVCKSSFMSLFCVKKDRLCNIAKFWKQNGVPMPERRGGARRSTDYGSTYERMNDKVGSKTVLSYLYVCPSNKRKIMVLTDPEFESSILISSDEGASFQKYRLTFYVLSLLFHPFKEDWALAYSHDQKLYSSVDFGRKWQLVHDHVTPNRFYWSVLGLDKESDLVHMEAHTPDGNVQYVTCRALVCSEANREFPFHGFVDINSLIVQDDYIFIQVPTSGRATYYVSYKREQFIQIKLPKYSLPKDLHIVSTDEKQVFAAVQEWNQNDTYNLYLSDTRGIYFTLAMENVKTTRGLGGNQNLDLYEVAGIKGMLIANKRQDNQVKTYITYNKGRDWRLLQAPSSDLEGNNPACRRVAVQTPLLLLITAPPRLFSERKHLSKHPLHVLQEKPFCSLHLQLQMSENPYLSGAITTKSSAPGIIVATGNIGPELSFNNVGMFISSDAGNSWRQVRRAPGLGHFHMHEGRTPQAQQRGCLVN